MSLDSTPSEGALSIEQATSLLSAPVDDAPQTGAPAEVAGEENEAPAPGAETGSEAEKPGDDGDVEEPDPEAEEAPEVKAPHWWTAEDKAEFALLTPKAQEVVARQEALREQVTSKAKEEAANERKAAETVRKSYSDTMQLLGKWLPEAVDSIKSQEAIFADNWGKVDWAALQKEYSAEQVNEWRFQHDAEKAKLEANKQALDKARTETEQATKAQRAEILKAEADKLKELCPPLMDPKEGVNRRKALAEFLVEAGVDRDQLHDLTGVALSLAYDAMQYRQAKAKLAKPPAPPPPSRVNSGPSATPGRSSQERSIEQIQARLAKSGSIEDGMALLQAQRKSG